MEIVVRRLAIRGRVQGVGYRGSMTREATHLNVSGWVRNRVDGSVEAVVAGSAAAVEAIIEWARRGPDGALVIALDVQTLPAQAVFDRFEQRPTA